MLKGVEAMNNKTKILVSAFIVLGLFFSLPLLYSKAGANESGKLTVTVESLSGENVSISVDFHEGDTLYDLLRNYGELTCANASYKPDSECKHTFKLNPFDSSDYDYFILGISIDGLEIMTDMSNTYLKIMIKSDGDSGFVYSQKGVRNIAIYNNMHILIKEEGLQNG